MNIFYLDRDPMEAARMLCDKHVVKMVLETAQLLSGPYSELENTPMGIYRKTHYNHPCSVWVRQSTGNYSWLVTYGTELAKEYRRRYGRFHKSADVILECHRKKDLLNIPEGDFTDPPQCMPEEYRQEDSVEAYRAYYVGEKCRFAKWDKGRPPPEWWDDASIAQPG